jgi:serine/threonine-protein kinase
VFCPFTGRVLADREREDPWIGASLGRYRLEQPLGAGGSGAVYRATSDDGTRVAIKILRSDVSPEPEITRARFAREIRAASSIRHPGVVRVLEAGDLPDGTPWLAMELVDGPSLRERLEQERRLPIDEALEIASSLLDTLAAAHAQGVIHRDVKPDNVLFAREGGRLVLRLADFGLARDLGPAITTPGSVLGTPRYLAPEIARGCTTLDGRVDVWSVGVLLYEMLTGERPFDGRDVVSTVLAILSKQLRPVRELRPEVPVVVEQCLSRALEKDPARRFASAGEMRMVVRAALAAESSRTDEMDALEWPAGAIVVDEPDELGETWNERLDRATTRRREPR